MKRNLGDTIPYLHVGNSHLVTRDGRIAAVIECSGRNLGVMSRDGAYDITRRYAHLLNRVGTDTLLQVVVTNRPVDPDDWVPMYMEQYASCPARLRPVRDDYASRLHEKLTGTHIPLLRYYMVLSVKVPTRELLFRKPRRLQRQPKLIFGESEYNAAVARVTDSAGEMCRLVGSHLSMAARPLVRSEIIDVLREFLSPHWHSIQPVKSEAVASGIDGETDPNAMSLHEALAMGALDNYQDHIALDTLRVRSLSLLGYPELTCPGWLRELISLPVNWRLLLNIEPLDKGAELAHFKSALRQTAANNAPLDGQQRSIEGVFKLLSMDPENVHKEADIASYVDLLSTTDERPFKVSAHIAITSESKKQLDRDTRAVIGALSADGSRMVDRRVIEQLPAWLCTLPAVSCASAWRSPTRNIADTFPMIHNHAGTPTGILLGWSDPGGEPVLLEQWSQFAPNALGTISGKAGAGKSSLAQKVALHDLMRAIKVIVLDHSDTAHWRDLTAVAGGRHFYVSTDGEISINPFELRGPDLENWRTTRQIPSEKRLRLLKVLALIVSDSGQLSAAQKAVLDPALAAIYRRADTPPHMEDLQVELLSSQDDLAQQMGRLLVPYTGDGVYAPFINRDTNLDDELPMLVFNFTRIDAVMVEVAMYLIFEYLMNRLRATRERVLLPIDEGWSFLKHDVMTDFIEPLAKKNRHTTASVMAMTQNLEDFANSPAARAIVSNSSFNFLLQHNPDTGDALQDLFHLTDTEHNIIAGFGNPPNEFKDAALGSPCWLHSRNGIERGKVNLWLTPEEYWLTTTSPMVRDEMMIRRRQIEELNGDVWGACRALARQVAS